MMPTGCGSSWPEGGSWTTPPARVGRWHARRRFRSRPRRVPGSEHGLTLANENSPRQFVLSGPLTRIEQAEEAAKASGVRAKKLAVAGAFHTEAMACGVEAFRAELAEIEFEAPEAPVISSTKADFFPDDPRDDLGSVAHPPDPLDVIAREARGAGRAALP